MSKKDNTRFYMRFKDGTDFWLSHKEEENVFHIHMDYAEGDLTVKELKALITGLQKVQKWWNTEEQDR